MIKAEAISHEGNPGPNWLDHCRTIATPTNIAVVLLLIVAGGLFIGLTRKERTSTANQLPATSNSQPATSPASSSLQVQPLLERTTTTNGSTTIQSAAGGSNSVAPIGGVQDKTGDALGAAKTPALNSSSNSNKSNQAPINRTKEGDDLQGRLQSTLEDTADGLVGTLNHFTNSGRNRSH